MRFLRPIFLGIFVLLSTSQAFGQCGVERWSVKTGTDPDSGLVNLGSTSSTSVATMRSWPKPGTIPANNRISPYETTQWVVNATLTQYKAESDSDYHLVLQDSGGLTMIAEIPSPSCVSGGPFASRIQTARNQFDAQYNATTSFQTANVPVQITGVGMFDFLHGQTGVAPNGIEIHTVLNIIFNPGTGADFTIASSPSSVSVVQGTFGTSSISTTVSGGFNSAVSLSATGLPSGATASFSPSSISAPGSGSSTITLSTSASTPAGTYPITVTGTGGGKTHSTTINLTVTTGTGGVTTLTNGQPVTVSGGTGSWNYYKITVPSGQTSLVIPISGGTGDADLYLKLGAQPTSTVYDYRSIVSGNTDSITVTNPAAGDWYIGVYGYAAYSGVTLKATYSGGGGGDTTAPTTSITAPTSGATVSGTTTVSASASDNVSVTKVEFYLDGALQSTDTTSPYSWSWDTTTATNGTHSLTTKAYDAALNVGTSSAVNVTVSNGALPVNIGNWTLTQANSTLTYTIPTGTTIASKGYVIIARNVTKTAFQTYWGVTLPANVVFINSGDTMPQMNGSETYTLKNSAGTTIEGTTVAMDSAGGSDFQRSTCGAIGTLSSWTKLASASGSPGTGGLNGCNKGPFINEFSDALGTGNYVYEFIELFNDK